MHNFGNLNDSEFEIFCKDMMERVLKVELKTYGRGRDGGIDLSDLSGKNKVIVQVKHYINSTFADLKKSLKGELEKVKKLQPEKYYICIGKTLTPGNVKEIYGMFSGYMQDLNNIVTLAEMNDFLSQENNNDILQKNYKLWLSSSNVFSLLINQNIFIDCEELVIDIENKSKYFVDTSAYYESLDLLKKEGAILIVGGPGVGKTTLSKMLILKYVSEGYSVRYSTDNSVSNIKNVLSKDKEKKEIILLDDFLGQHYLKIKDNQPNEIKSLISFVKRNENKKIILNSRQTILNEAMRSHLDFRQFMDDQEDCKYIINMDKVGLFDKAKILYNHLYFNEIPRDYFLNIKEEKKYKTIVEHENYNPRIIEYATKRSNYEQVTPSEYGSYILNKLDDPVDVWANEFEDRIEATDRILLTVLYSLTNNLVEESMLEYAFNARIRSNLNIDKSVNQFELSLKRLSDSLLIIVNKDRKRKIGVANPSINDFLQQYIKKNINEREELLKHAVFFEQIKKLDKIHATEIFIEKIEENQFLNLKCVSGSIELQWIKLIVKNNIKNKDFVDIFPQVLMNCCTNINEKDTIDYSYLIVRIFTGEFLSFYNLEQIVFNDTRFSDLVKNVHLEGVGDIAEYVVGFFEPNEEDLENFIDNVRYILLEKYYEEKWIDFDEMSYERARDKVSDCDYCPFESKDEFVGSLVSELKEEIIEEISKDFENDFCTKYNYLGITINDLDFDGIVENIEFYSAIETHLEPDFESEYEDYLSSKEMYSGNEMNAISEMFER